MAARFEQINQKVYFPVANNQNASRPASPRVVQATGGRILRRRTTFTFAEIDHEDLGKGATPINREGERSLFDHRWVWMGLVVLAVGLITRIPALLAIPGFMLTIAIVCWFWSRPALNALYYQRTFQYKRVFPGETIEAQIITENAKWLPLTWLQIEDEWPLGVGTADESIMTPGLSDQDAFLVNVYSLRWYDRVRRNYLLLARTRGVYPIGPAHLISGDPFSLFERGKTLTSRHYLVVYPEVKPLIEFGLPVADPFGDQAVPQRLFEDPLRTVGVRDYQPGDSIRRVHWKATARMGNLQVRQYEPTRALSLSLCLNIASFDQHWQGTWVALIEHVISVSASLAAWALEHDYAVGVLANAPLGQADQALRAKPGRSRDQLSIILEALAGINYFVTQEYGNFMIKESASLPWGTTLALITGMINDPILTAIARLRGGGRRVMLFAVGPDAPPTLIGVPTFHLPIPAERPVESDRKAQRPVPITLGLHDMRAATSSIRNA